MPARGGAATSRVGRRSQAGHSQCAVCTRTSALPPRTWSWSREPSGGLEQLWTSWGWFQGLGGGLVHQGQVLSARTVPTGCAYPLWSFRTPRTKKVLGSFSAVSPLQFTCTRTAQASPSQPPSLRQPGRPPPSLCVHLLLIRFHNQPTTRPLPLMPFLEQANMSKHSSAY